MEWEVWREHARVNLKIDLPKIDTLTGLFAMISNRFFKTNFNSIIGFFIVILIKFCPNYGKYQNSDDCRKSVHFAGHSINHSAEFVREFMVELDSFESCHEKKCSEHKKYSFFQSTG